MIDLILYQSSSHVHGCSIQKTPLDTVKVCGQFKIKETHKNDKVWWKIRLWQRWSVHLIVRYNSQIFFSLISGHPPMDYFGVGCDNWHLGLECPKGYAITVQNATYGRFDTEECLNNDDGENLRNVTCAGESVYDTVKVCDDHDQCLIYVNTTHFGDPCPGISKYLYITFTCSSKYIYGHLKSYHRPLCFQYNQVWSQTPLFNTTKSDHIPYFFQYNQPCLATKGKLAKPM